MKNRKITIILISLIILIGSVIFFVYKKDKKVYEDIKENKITLAIMVEKGTGKYVEYKSKEWPKYGYKYVKAECVDRDRNNIGNLITYDALTYEARMKSTRTAFCTLYFDKDNSAPVISDESFYVGESIDQEYTNKINEEVHIKIDDDDVIEYCLSLDSDSRSCNNNWNTIPELTDGWFTVSSFNLGNTDGTKIVYLYLKDEARNISSKEDSIVLDTTNPTCKLWGESTSWTKNNRTIRWGCEDATSGCKAGEVGNKEYNTTTKTSTIQYEIEDNAKNKITCNLTANVYVDKTAPTCGTSWSGGSTTWTKDNRTLSISCSDGTNQSGCSQASYSQTYSTTTKVAKPSVTISDAAGNTKVCTASTDQNVYVDKTAPTCGTSWSGGSTTWTKDNRTLSISCSDGTNQSGCSQASYSQTYSTTTKVAKPSVTISDVAGNTRVCTASTDQNVYVDKEAPTLNVTNTSNGSSYSGAWTKYNISSALTFSDSNSGINASSLKWGTDGTTWTAISNTSTTGYNDTWSSERNGTGYYQICDVAGNCASKNFTVKIDKTNPTISVSNKTADGSTYSGKCTTQNVNSTVTYSDSSSGINASTFAWSDDNSTWHTISGASTTTGTDTWSSNRSQTVYYRICDNATNCNTVSFYLDKRSSCGGGGGGGGGGSTGEACSFSKKFYLNEESDVQITATCSGTKEVTYKPCMFDGRSGSRTVVRCTGATCIYGGRTYASGVSTTISQSSCLVAI